MGGRGDGFIPRLATLRACVFGNASLFFFFWRIIMEAANAGRRGRIRGRIGGAGGHGGVTGTRLGTASRPRGAIIPRQQVPRCNI